MYLVDEENDVGVLLQLVDDGVQAFLELAAVLGACHHAGHVQHNDALVEEHARHLLLRDAQGQSFDNGALAYARFSDEHGVVFLSAAQDLRHAFNLLFAPYDGIQASVSRRAGHVGAELVQYGRVARGTSLGGLRAPRGTCGRTAGHVVHFVILLVFVGESHAGVRVGGAHGYHVEHLGVIHVVFAQHAGSQVVSVLEDSQQQVFGVHRIALQQACLEYADFQDARGDGGQGDVRIGRQALIGLYLEVVFYAVFQ